MSRSHLFLLDSFANKSWAWRAAKFSPPLSIASWNFFSEESTFHHKFITSVIKHFYDVSIKHSNCFLLIICTWIKQATRINKQCGIEIFWFPNSSFYVYPYNSALSSNLKVMLEESTDNIVSSEVTQINIIHNWCTTFFFLVIHYCLA